MADTTWNTSVYPVSRPSIAKGWIRIDGNIRPDYTHFITNGQEASTEDSSLFWEMKELGYKKKIKELEDQLLESTTTNKEMLERLLGMIHGNNA